MTDQLHPAIGNPEAGPIESLPTNSKIDDIKRIAGLVREDIADHPSTTRAVGILSATVGVELIAGLRVPTLATTEMASWMTQQTHSGTLTTLATATAYAAWAYTSSGFVSATIETLPKTFNVWSNAAANNQAVVEQYFPQIKKDRPGVRGIRRFGRHAGDGVTAFACLTPQVLAAGLYGHDVHERRSLRKRLTVGATAVLVAGGTAGIAVGNKVYPEGTHAVEHHPVLSALGIVALSGTIAHFNKKLRSKSQPETEVDIPEVA